MEPNNNSNMDNQDSRFLELINKKGLEKAKENEDGMEAAWEYYYRASKKSRVREKERANRNIEKVKVGAAVIASIALIAGIAWGKNVEKNNVINAPIIAVSDELSADFPKGGPPESKEEYAMAFLSSLRHQGYDTSDPSDVDEILTLLDHYKYIDEGSQSILPSPKGALEMIENKGVLEKPTELDEYAQGRGYSSFQELKEETEKQIYENRKSTGRRS